MGTKYDRRNEIIDTVLQIVYSPSKRDISSNNIMRNLVSIDRVRGCHIPLFKITQLELRAIGFRRNMMRRVVNVENLGKLDSRPCG